MSMRSNMLLNSDSYKFSHWAQYPTNTEFIFSYIESRGGVYNETTFFGLQAFLKDYLSKPFTQADIDEANAVITAHGLPFNKAGFESMLRKHGGYFPVRIRAIPEGLTIPVSNVMTTIENTDPEFYWVTSFLETALLRAVWYPVTVCTISRHILQVIANNLEETGDPAGLPFKLHDFGARGQLH